MNRLCWLALCAVTACGDNTTPTDGIPPLVADPATRTDCASDLPTEGESRAKFVVCEDELLGGRMAAGRIGDLVLENSRIRAIVRGPGDGLYLYGTTGGAIVDAAPHGRDDLLQEIVPLLELNTGLFTEIVVTEAGDDGPAEIAVRGVAAPTPLFASALGTQAAGAIIEQRYRLAPDDTAIEMELRLYSDPAATETTPVAGLIDVLFTSGRIELGFPGLPSDAARGPFLATTGTTSNYAITQREEDGASVTLVELAFFKLLEGPAITVDAEPFSRFLVVGDGSMASVVDRAWEIYGAETGVISGTATAGVNVVARTANGSIANVARAGDDGAFSMRVRPGSYELTAEAENRSPGETVTASSGQSGVSLTAGPTGELTLTATADGVGSVTRVEITDGGGFERLEYTAADGEAIIGLPPGTYTVNVSKGMEHDAFTATNVVVPPDGTTSLVAALTNVLDTDGWISIDPHIHSEMSIDSNVVLEDRLHSIAAEGVEIAVSSDHDFIVDYAPVAVDLGLDSVLKTMPGQESSSLIIGHVNAWPTPFDPARPGGGALPWYDSGPRTVFDAARDGDNSRIVQVNHPWDALGLFTAIGFDRNTLMATKTGADLGVPGADLSDFSFDALEIGNKKTEEGFEQSFGDWLALVSSGLRIAGTGASDSHGDDAYVGEVRSYVYVGAGNDDPTALDDETINTAIRDMNVVVASGIFVTAGLVTGAGTSLPGELVDHSSETEATIRIRVQAPPWMPVSAVVIYEGETEISRTAIDTGETQAIRFDADVAVPLGGQDSLFIVAALPGGDGRPVMDEPKPSFVNPLYVDVDGNGLFEP